MSVTCVAISLQGLLDFPLEREREREREREGGGAIVLTIAKYLVTYHIALIFRGSKFSQIAALKEFFLQIRVAHGCYSAVAQIFVE